MERQYTIGKFAKMANVTTRTIRYYDSYGLLKPSVVKENGYRYYSDGDLLKLQRILLLKQLGFSLEEITPIVLNDDVHSFRESLQVQMDLVDQKIEHLTLLRDALKNTEVLLEKDQMEWNRIIELIQLTNNDRSIIDQYHNSTNLNVRIELHQKFSTNPIPWFKWIYDQIPFYHVNRLLELGCGNGKMWDYLNIDLRNRDFYLTDLSRGMVEDTKKRLNNVDMNYMVVDCEQIPFKDQFFDCIIANHMLFYLKNRDHGLQEIKRVLKTNGTFYCTTYSQKHMKELNNLVQEYDPRIKLSNLNLYEQFGLENGHEILSDYFNHVEMKVYQDELIVNEVNPLVNYVLSCHGNQNEIIGKNVEQFKTFIENKMKITGSIKITKEACLFICNNL